MMQDVRVRDANRDPQRWVDESGRVRVIEGWHPSEPTRLGYNVLVDDDWLGTFDTLDRAADAASSSARFRRLPVENGRVVLTRVPDPWGRGTRFKETGLHAISDPEDEHDA
jgi:hypothetical protein